ncbi:MAG: flagellar hook protein FlgE [Rhodocyclaceae bacterium]|nr:flagellar hook protein FlgE [Rhodocyclaceae bacterium]
MAFQQGLSGLGASSRALDVISSNVANSSTVGFKASSTVFADTFASAMGGGVSNLQVGMGGNTLAVRQSFTQGATTSTNNPLDMAIGGNGFFVIDRANGTQAYSRNGQFDLNKDGFIVNSLGEKLQGYKIENNITAGVISGISVPPDGIGATATSGVVSIRGNLDSDALYIPDPADPTDLTLSAFVPDDPAVADSSHDPATYNYSTSATVYDSLGVQHSLSMYFVKSGTPANAWNVYYEFDGNALPPDAAGNAQNGPYQIIFNTSGVYDSPLPVAVEVDGATILEGKAATMTFNLDLSDFTQNSSSSAIYEITQNGLPPGELNGISVNSTGIVLAQYTNGTTQNLAQVALATFSSPNGLTSLGDNLWSASIDSGEAIIAAPGTGVNGTIGSGRVEESNVDMSAELVNMIIQQRNYQANAQSIKTQDQILQTLINLR